MNNYDDYVCAEIPDPITQPRLHAAVTGMMLHGFCTPASPCWRNGACSKHFPFAFCDETHVTDNGMRVIHRRRSPENGGREFVRRDYVYNNSHVVPYNPYLLLRFNAHINVVICTSAGWIKYLYVPDMIPLSS